MKSRVWIALIAVYIFWGSTYLGIRIGLETIPPFMLAGMRFLIAGAILYSWRRLAGDPAPERIEWRSAAVVGALLLLGGNGGVVWAEQRVDSGIAALMIGSVPLWMVLLDTIRAGGHPPGKWAILGLALGSAGILFLVAPWQAGGVETQVDPVGALVLLLAAFLWAVGSLYSRKAPLPDSPLMGTAAEMLVGGAVLMLVSGLTNEWSGFDLAAVSTRSWLGLIWLIVFGSLIAFAAYTWLLRAAPTPLVSTYAYVNPLVALVLGNLIAQEPLGLRVLFSAALIVSSIMLVNTARSRPLAVRLSTDRDVRPT